MTTNYPKYSSRYLFKCLNLNYSILHSISLNMFVRIGEPNRPIISQKYFNILVRLKIKVNILSYHYELRSELVLC